METQNVGMLERFKSWFNWDAISQKLNLSKDKFIEVGIYLGIGFLTGFLLKKYAQLILFLILFIVGIVVLQQVNVLSVVINWERVESLFGIQRAAMSTSTLTMLWEWIKLNLLIVVSFVIGFFFGLKVG